ncbi:hypothetical protein ACS0TY_013308 [Phlomoides rotata]
MVACDSMGYFLAGRMIWFPGDISASEVESCNMGFNSVVVEMDAKVVCDAINEKRIGESTFGSYVSPCIGICSSFFSCNFNFVRRQANIVVHSFARVSRLYESLHTLVKPSDFVDDLLKGCCTSCE